MKSGAPQGGPAAEGNGHEPGRHGAAVMAVSMARAAMVAPERGEGHWRGCWRRSPCLAESKSPT